MIDEIQLKFGSSPGAPKLAFVPTAVTVFVGPNNAGKSKAIKEIAAQCQHGQQVPSDVIVESITFTALGQQAATSACQQLQIPPPAGQAVAEGHIFIKTRSGNRQIFPEHCAKALMEPNTADWRLAFAEYYLSLQTLVLSGQGRVDLVNDQPGGDMQHPPMSSFQKLFRDDPLRDRFSNTVSKSLSGYPVLDPTNLGQLRLRLSPIKPQSVQVERGLDAASIAFHGAAQPITEASDGARAFAGILAEVMAGDPGILMIDEPEAFLHPSLAYNLGREIVRSLAGSGRHLFVSTHSAQFLMGCLQAGTSVNVVRLTYRDKVATARLLPNAEIVKLMRNPLLRSVGVISALFYESVVVTEADSDRAFYQEINERLLRDDRGIPNCIFLNAQNKQTIPTIIEPLRKLGIPSAGIYDIDLFECGGAEATKIMASAGVPPLSQQPWSNQRGLLLTALKKADAQYKRNGGIDVLTDADKAAAASFLDGLDDYGAFAVRGGELEAWLKHVHQGGHGPTWLIPMFEAMGEDPTQPDYAAPAVDDVWAFIDKVAKWLLDPNRKGIPT